MDNGDGTLTDNKTGLMWEKKTGTVGPLVDCSTTGCFDPHYVNNTYQWCSGTFPNCTNPSNPPDGGVFTDFLARVNGTLCETDTCPGLGGHSDWRVPTLAELRTIVNLSAPCGTGPCIDPVFGPTVPGFYWSSSTEAGSPSYAWFVMFFYPGFWGGSPKMYGWDAGGGRYVRAVRGGL